MVRSPSTSGLGEQTGNRIDEFHRIAIPGGAGIRLGSEEGRVLYLEGDEEDTSLRDLTLTVTGPDGSAVRVEPYEGELIYETEQLEQGHAVATFDATGAGVYRVEVNGTVGGVLVVGESVAKGAIPGILGGLAIIGGSLMTALLIGLVTPVRRSQSVQGPVQAIPAR